MRNKIIEKGKYTLEHSMGSGSFGQPADMMWLRWKDDDGRAWMKFVVPPVRVSTDVSIFASVESYSDDEYFEIIDREIKVREGLDTTR